MTFRSATVKLLSSRITKRHSSFFYLEIQDCLSDLLRQMICTSFSSNKQEAILDSLYKNILRKAIYGDSFSLIVKEKKVFEVRFLD